MISSILGSLLILGGVARLTLAAQVNATARLNLDRSPSSGYSTNAICLQRNCIHPPFPGFLDLQQLEALTWQCQSHGDVKQFLRFCDDVVNYDVAIASPNTSTGLAAIVQAQEQAALTTYFYHLSGLNMDAWQYKDVRGPAADPCAEATRQMVCHTYFPKAEAGCNSGEATTFLRPCASVCSSYASACNVQCCDESAKCVVDSGSTNSTKRYVDAKAPDATCTGTLSLVQFSSTQRSASSFWTLMGLIMLPLMASGSIPELAGAGFSSGNAGAALLPVTLVAISSMLQGCDMVHMGIVASGHATSNWEKLPNYLTTYKYIAPGKMVSEGVMNSCELPDLPASERCSGNGVCTQWNSTSAFRRLRPITFCLCNRDWADPECRTQRKSHMTAFLLSVFTGFIGLDSFYLGEYYSGFGKVSSLGGFGVWWLYDVVRIGSTPIYADNFRLADDLPHWVYVCVVVLWASLLSYLVFGIGASAALKKKRMSQLLLQAEDEFMKTDSNTSYRLVNMPRASFSSYGSVMHPAVFSQQRLLGQGHYLAPQMANTYTVMHPPVAMPPVTLAPSSVWVAGATPSHMSQVGSVVSMQSQAPVLVSSTVMPAIAV